MSRCEICDYSEGLFNHYLSRSQRSKVRRRGDQYLCDECYQIICDAAYDQAKEEGELALLDTNFEEAEACLTTPRSPDL